MEENFVAWQQHQHNVHTVGIYLLVLMETLTNTRIVNLSFQDAK